VRDWNNPGQVAQSVERGPEKAGVGGSIPSLATTIFNKLESKAPTLPVSWWYPPAYASNNISPTFGCLRPPTWGDKVRQQRASQYLFQPQINLCITISGGD
jgi:hypothetical protein